MGLMKRSYGLVDLCFCLIKYLLELNNKIK